MEELKIKKIEINEVDEIILLSVEEARKIPQNILACGDWWWLRSSGHRQGDAALVSRGGIVHPRGYCVNFDYCAIHPAFRLNNLNAKIYDKVMIGKTWCTVIDEGLALTDYSICKRRFDEKSNNWESSELKEFINSEGFKAMI